MKMSTGKHSLKLHLVLLALLIAVVGFVIWLYTGYVGESTPYEVTNYAMGTYVQQTVYGKNGQAGASAAANAISSLENEISWRVDGSEIQKLNEQAGKVYEQLSADFMTDYDDAGSIGKRYRRQDEIGTPFCITYDFESVDDGCVTVRDRDTMQQERVAIDKLNDYIAEKIKF